MKATQTVRPRTGHEADGPPNGLRPRTKKLDLPSVEEFQQRVEERAETVDLSMEEVNELVHKARDADD
jgi:hypothetical protein